MCRFIQCGTEQMAFLKYGAEVLGDRWGRRKAHSASGEPFSPFEAH